MAADQETGAQTSSSTARSRVREDIRKLILCGEFRPGERLAQQHLAKRFGVAQSVVRESLLELQFTGLVQSVDNLGIFVSGLQMETLMQAYQVREMLEGLAARLCCERASRADVRELADLAERAYRSGIEGNDRERGALDRRFHRRTVEISQNVVLARVTEAYHALGMIVNISRSHEVIRDEHLGIVDAIAGNDPDEAERRARLHVQGVRAAITQQVAEGTFAPKWVVD